MTDCNPEDVLRLSAPIRAGGSDLSELRFRKPALLDCRRIQNALKARNDAEILAQLISILAEAPMSSVNQLVARDFAKAVRIVKRLIDTASARNRVIITRMGTRPGTRR